jgi:hypothetical protein
MENNKLIAEFMQPSFNGFGTYDFNGQLLTKEYLKFDTDWNWLMKVVEKCREESNDEDSYWEAIYYSLVDLDIDSVYNAVVKFITWYNETKQK